MGAFVSLTLERLHRLRGKGFDKLYTDHADKWQEMVTNATTFAKTYIGNGEKIRPGDLVEILQNSIKVDPDFEGYVKLKTLQQKYWVEWFSEYIMDQIFPTNPID
jgi:hypothetical protein